MNTKEPIYANDAIPFTFWSIMYGICLVYDFLWFPVTILCVHILWTVLIYLSHEEYITNNYPSSSYMYTTLPLWVRNAYSIILTVLWYNALNEYVAGLYLFCAVSTNAAMVKKPIILNTGEEE